MEKQSIVLTAVFLLIVLSFFTAGCGETQYQSGAAIQNNPTDSGSGSGSGQLPSAQQSSGQQIQILNHVLEKTDYGTVQVTGTAKNVAGKQLSYVEIRVKFYDKNNVLLDTFFDNINDLDPDQTWKFEVIYPGLDSGEVDHYDIGVGTVL